MPIVCIVRLPIFCLSMSEDSQPAPELVSLLPRPHTREFLHKHGPGAVIHRHSHDYHQLIYVSTGVLAIHTERAPTGRAQPRRN
jgi:quercetin dioxygenase-like cupin family protein